MSSDDLLVLWTCFDRGGGVHGHPVAGATVSSTNASILDIGPVLTRQRRLSYESTEHGIMEHGSRADLLAGAQASQQAMAVPRSQLLDPPGSRAKAPSSGSLTQNQASRKRRFPVQTLTIFFAFATATL